MATESARKPVIAIDGPAGAGKSTVAKAVARALGFAYIDTGAMYRAIALKAIERGVPVENEEEIVALARATRLEFVRDEAGETRLLMDGRDVSQAIRRPEVGRLSSPVSAIAGVRRVLVERQREMGREGGVVMEGRDIQTNVFPEAEVKIFLTASPEERARRRQRDLRARGIDLPYDEVLAEIRERDERDSSRPLNPLRKAPDALEVFTDDLSIDDVVERILQYAAQTGVRPAGQR